MGLILSEEWLLAQNRVIGAALLDETLVPRVVTELTPSDFTGNARAIYDAMAKCFRESSTPDAVNPVVIAQAMGDSPANRTLLAQYMELSPTTADFDRYLTLAKQQSKLNRIRDLGHELAEAATLEDALSKADEISNHLMERPGLKRFSPEELLTAWGLRHSTPQHFADWSIPTINDYVRLKPGKFYIIGAEPSGGKTAFALEQMMRISASKRVLFCSLETDEVTLFDRLISSVAEIPLDAMENGTLTGQQAWKVQELSDYISQRNFTILPCAGLSVAGVKAAAISAKADVVIVDYLQLLQSTSKKQSRYEAVTEISMDLHILAQSTGLTVIALSQVTNRDPQAKRTPLGIHSARESGQIEADADAILMLDKHVEKNLKDSGCRANRILRIVKNKNGRCCNIPLYFDGRFQKFSRAVIPDPDWESKQKSEPKKQQSPPKPGTDWEQLPLTEDVPF